MDKGWTTPGKPNLHKTGRDYGQLKVDYEGTFNYLVLYKNEQASPVQYIFRFIQAISIL